MTFGNWNEDIHKELDQIKRYNSALKADMTPTEIDTDTQTGIFKGSGKKPYETRIDFCSCSDFRKRKLPCKHIYRLAMELGLYKGNFDTGINKFDLNKQLFSLHVDVQKKLYDMVYMAKCISQNVFIFKRDAFPQYMDLLQSGFCVEIMSNIGSSLSSVPVSDIKIACEGCDIPGIPPLTSQKKTFINWFNFAEANYLSDINNNFILLQLTEQTVENANKIFLRFRKKFIKINNERFDEETFIYYGGVEYEEVFNNDIP